MSVTIGRIVLYTLPVGCKSINGARTFPAIVTMVHDAACVNLRVFFDRETLNFDPAEENISEQVTSVLQSPPPGEPGCWCWPPRS